MTVSAITTSRVTSAIAQAASRTGVDFDYLLGQAKLESGLDSNARASTSSATGLYQFLDQSWLSVVKKHGAEHGLGWAADAIGPAGNGRYGVGDAGTRQAILALRNDPQVSSLMAASSAADNGQALQSTLGRPATGTDLYMAHFLGLGGATRFLSAMKSNPSASAASLFPAAASANRNVFYAADGSARSVSDIYARMAAKLDRAGADPDVAATAAANTAQNFGSRGYAYAAQAIEAGDGSTVVTGNGESAGAALAWARGATGRSGFSDRGALASIMRPTPANARLAYLMLAGMGG